MPRARGNWKINYGNPDMKKLALLGTGDLVDICNWHLT